MCGFFVFFFFSSRRRHTRLVSDWSSDVCSSDLLTIVDEQNKSIRRFTNFAEEVKDASFSDILVLGMGGSSLCPEVLAKSFGRIEKFPKLHVLDSTDPAQIKSFENKIDLANTLFI